MSAPISIGIIPACANQKGAFSVQFTPSVGVDLTSALVTCQIRGDAQPATPLVSPDVDYGMVGDDLLVVISWTQAQSAALVAPGKKFTITTEYAIDIELAFEDDPTHPSLRFFGTLEVSPGGLV